ncbi:hypothetical protein D3C85_1731600 [compost metagenome]
MALFTDYVFGDDAALRYSLLIVTSLAVSSSVVLLWMGLKPYRESLKRLQQWGVAAQDDAMLRQAQPS